MGIGLGGSVDCLPTAQERGRKFEIGCGGRAVVGMEVWRFTSVLPTLSVNR